MLFATYSLQILQRIPYQRSSESFGDFNTGGQVIRTVKYANDVVLLAKEETILQGMIDGITEIGKCYVMEMNVGKTKAMRISRQPSPVQNMIDQK
jgi:hypothetical protein